MQSKTFPRLAWVPLPCDLSSTCLHWVSSSHGSSPAPASGAPFSAPCWDVSHHVSLAWGVRAPAGWKRGFTNRSDAISGVFDIRVLCSTRKLCFLENEECLRYFIELHQNYLANTFGERSRAGRRDMWESIEVQRGEWSGEGQCSFIYLFILFCTPQLFCEPPQLSLA